MYYVNIYYYTQTWVYVQTIEEGDEQPIMRYKKSTQQFSCQLPFYSNETADDVPPCVNPVDGKVKGQRIYPYQDNSMERKLETSINVLDTTDDHPKQVQPTEKLSGVLERSMDPIIDGAAFSWVITQEEDQAKIWKSKVVLANPKYMISYRAELTGLHDLLKQIVQNKKQISIHFELQCYL